MWAWRCDDDDVAKGVTELLLKNVDIQNRFKENYREEEGNERERER